MNFSFFIVFGVWPNWLWRTLRVREVPGSSPGTPTNFIEERVCCRKQAPSFLFSS